MKRLDKKVAAVTGAASGIGRALALAFADEGACVIALDQANEPLGRLATALGPAHLALSTDVAEEAAVAAAFKTIADRYGRLDVLLNCAGVQLVDADTQVHRLDLEAWRRTLDVNLTGLFLCCKYGLQIMLGERRGSIINCGSPTGMTGRGWRFHAYSASKGGVLALTKAMAAAYGPSGIRVNCLVPGTIRTGMTRAIFDEGGSRTAELTERTALRRLGEPGDLVGAAVFLASDESAYVAGTTLVVDGGLLVT